jgi:hypothetical protein
LDTPDFDAVSYINSLFPTEHVRRRHRLPLLQSQAGTPYQWPSLKSLASLDDTIFSLRKKLRWAPPRAR